MDTTTHPTKIHEASQKGDTDFLQLYLRTKRSGKVEARIVELSLESGHPHVVDLFVNRKNTHPNIIQLALSWSITHQKQWVKHFVALGGAMENPTEMLKLAIKTPNTAAIDVLLPHVSAGSSEILCAAVRTSDVDIVRKVLPICNPKEQCSAALQEAVAFQNQEIFDILYPLSTPQEAWDSIRKDSWFDARQRTMIKSRLDIDRQKLKLEKAVHSRPENLTVPALKAKKI